MSGPHRIEAGGATGAAERAWQAFIALPTTVANERRDYPEWHRGRRRYAVWAIALEAGPWDRRLADAALALDGLLLPGYERQPHVTLRACGFPAACIRHDDDYLLEHFQAQCDALRRVAIGPFDMHVGGIASFATAPYLEVGDPDRALPRLRDALDVGTNEFRDTEYVPHVTVGLYGGAHPVSEVAARMASLRNAPPLFLRVRRIALMAYDSRVVGGPLETLCEFDLADNLLLVGDRIFPDSTRGTP